MPNSSIWFINYWPHVNVDGKSVKRLIESKINEASLDHHHNFSLSLFLFHCLIHINTFFLSSFHSITFDFCSTLNTSNEWYVLMLERKCSGFTCCALSILFMCVSMCVSMQMHIWSPKNTGYTRKNSDKWTPSTTTRNEETVNRWTEYNGKKARHYFENEISVKVQCAWSMTEKRLHASPEPKIVTSLHWNT